MKIGEIDISKVMVGSDEIAAIYAGTDLVYSSTPPTPPTPTFNGKWIATYSDSHTSSAECDSSSAITQGEITLANLVSVQIGDCVTSIGKRAFKKCTSLTGITIPDSVTSISSSALTGCYGLTSLTIPNSVTSIGGAVFFNCTGLTSVIIGSGVTSIGDSAFSSCSSLTNITIPDSVTSIGLAAFQYSSSLTSVTVLATTPPTLESWAFDNTNNCPIYVPSESLSAYQSASGWSDYASRLIENNS